MLLLYLFVLILICRVSCLNETPYSNLGMQRVVLHRNIRNSISSIFTASLFKPNAVRAQQQSMQGAFKESTTDSSYLHNRGLSSDSSVYEPGIQDSDVFYPVSFTGKWNVSSVFRNVFAPLGPEVFGGENIYNSALQQLNTTLVYASRFKDYNETAAINDRLYNVEQIAEAAMGKNSIINDAQSSDDLAVRLQLAISPPVSNGTIFDIELVTTDREFGSTITPRISGRNRIKLESNVVFDVLEKTQQIIRVRSNPPTLPLRKNIETITCYRIVDENTMVATQRTATFLSPFDPRYKIAQSKDERVANTAVDIRSYDVIYKRMLS